MPGHEQRSSGHGRARCATADPSGVAADMRCCFWRRRVRSPDVLRERREPAAGARRARGRVSSPYGRRSVRAGGASFASCSPRAGPREASAASRQPPSVRRSWRPRRHDSSRLIPQSITVGFDSACSYPPCAATSSVAILYNRLSPAWQATGTSASRSIMTIDARSGRAAAAGFDRGCGQPKSPPRYCSVVRRRDCCCARCSPLESVDLDNARDC